MKTVSVQVGDFGLFPFVNLQYILECSANVLEWTGSPGGGGYFLIRAQWGRTASQGMFFGIFVLNRVSTLSFFGLIRVSIYQLFS